jgi:hypothetical protein
MAKLLFGSDPELFASKKDSDGKDYVVPPVFFRNELGEPIKEFDRKHPTFQEIKINSNEVIKVIEDGAAFELTVPPRTNIMELIDLIHTGYDKVEEIVSKHGYNISIIPTINYNTEEYLNMGDDFLMCLLFGCDPDLDAFNTDKKQYEESALEHPYRYGGGHIHISGSEFIQRYPIPAVRLLALTVGNFVTANSPIPELEHLRTYRYGQPGKYRIQHYKKLYNNQPFTETGIEYRTPSNTWTKIKNMAEGVQFWAEIAIEKVLPNRKLGNKILKEMAENGVMAILETNQILAKRNLDMMKDMTGE